MKKKKKRGSKLNPHKLTVWGGGGRGGRSSEASFGHIQWTITRV